MTDANLARTSSGKDGQEMASHSTMEEAYHSLLRRTFSLNCLDVDKASWKLQHRLAIVVISFQSPPQGITSLL